MSDIKTFNQYALKTEGLRNEILTKGSLKDEIPPPIRTTFERIMELLFNGNLDLYVSKTQPYIFFKHLFRKYMHSFVDSIQEVANLEERLCGVRPGRSAIANSLQTDKNQYTLHPELLRRVESILNRNNIVVNEIINRLKEGKTHEEIAKECMVSREAIVNILQDEKVSSFILAQVENELTDYEF